MHRLTDLPFKTLHVCFPYFLEMEFIRVRNSLFTACKVGDVDALNDILSGLNINPTQPGANETSVPKSSTVTENIGETQSNSVNTLEPKALEITVPENNTLNMVELLNTTFGDQGRTLLHIAATHGHKDVLHRLLEVGADPTLK